MKKTFTIILMLLLTSVFIFFGCRKIDRSTAKDITARIDSTGTCGFLIKVNSTGTSFNAVNLPQLYYRDSLKIVMSYHLLDTKFQCATQTVATYQEIYIDAIHKQ
jgi:hypothetical protein